MNNLSSLGEGGRKSLRQPSLGPDSLLSLKTSSPYLPERNPNTNSSLIPLLAYLTVVGPMEDDWLLHALLSLIIAVDW